MPAETSLVRRVAWAAALAASAAALIAAVATSALAVFLLQGAEDRRLRDAAVILAGELDAGPPSAEHAEAVVRDESKETSHTGLLFAVLDEGGRFLAGDRRVGVPPRGNYSTEGQGRLRLCWVKANHGWTAVAASAHSLPTSRFALAATVAALLSGAVAWVASRPVARKVIAPLARLRARIAALPVDTKIPADLGPAERVSEVDQLRETLAQLLGRVNQALEQAQRFAANAAHELRTPLTAVRAELELLAEDAALSAGAVEGLARAEKTVAELALLVDRLLILATPRGALGDATEVVSLRDLIEDAVGALAPEERQRIRVEERDASIRGDAVVLGTMVSNAITNALKFGSVVHVGIAVEGREAVVHVDDDGPGVPDEDRDRVFEPFYRSDEARHRRLPGHGLGLALVRHIAETHGGRAAFIAKEERGARLEIRFPLSSESPAIPGPA